MYQSPKLLLPVRKSVDGELLKLRCQLFINIAYHLAILGMAGAMIRQVVRILS